MKNKKSKPNNTRHYLTRVQKQNIAPFLEGAKWKNITWVGTNSELCHKIEWACTQVTYGSTHIWRWESEAAAAADKEATLVRLDMQAHEQSGHGMIVLL